MRRIAAEVERAAALSSTVLLLGETGVGKGLVARTLHGRSPRRHLPFVHADCASLAPSVLESELFGHERGAFTGAVARRIGRLERAGAGTLFLDEVGELDAALQGRLLRVLQDREFERVGSSEPRRFGARVVAATQRDLARDVRAGRFRADLFYRLDVIRIAIPPLRERREDIPPLCAALLARIAARHGAAAPLLCAAAVEAFARHPWPGNVRELENALERLIARSPGTPVTGERRARGAPPVPRAMRQTSCATRRPRAPTSRAPCAKRAATSRRPRARSACRAPRCAGGSPHIGAPELPERCRDPRMRPARWISPQPCSGTSHCCSRCAATRPRTPGRRSAGAIRPPISAGR